MQNCKYDRRYHGTGTSVHLDLEVSIQKDLDWRIL